MNLIQQHGVLLLAVIGFCATPKAAEATATDTHVSVADNESWLLELEIAAGVDIADFSIYWEWYRYADELTSIESSFLMPVDDLISYPELLPSQVPDSVLVDILFGTQDGAWLEDGTYSRRLIIEFSDRPSSPLTRIVSYNVYFSVLAGEPARISADAYSELFEEYASSSKYPDDETMVRIGKSAYLEYGVTSHIVNQDGNWEPHVDGDRHFALPVLY